MEIAEYKVFLYVLDSELPIWSWRACCCSVLAWLRRNWNVKLMQFMLLLHWRWNMRHHVPEMNIYMLTSSKLTIWTSGWTSYFNTIFLFWAVLSGCFHTAEQLVVAGTICSLGSRNTCCSRLRTVTSIFPCASGKKLGRELWGMSGGSLTWTSSGLALGACHVLHYGEWCWGEWWNRDILSSFVFYGLCTILMLKFL